MMRSLLFVLLVGCSEPKSPPIAKPTVVVAPVAHVEQPAAPAAPAKPEEAKTPSAWRDFDDLPPGAVKRLGSSRYMSASDVVDIRDDGTMALSDDDHGLIELRVDGKYRVVAAGCTSSSFVRYAGGELRADCGKEVIALSGDVVTRVGTACQGDGPISKSGEFYACSDGNNALSLYRWPSTFVWKLAGAGSRTTLVTDAGEIVVVDGERMRGIRDGREIWTKPSEVHWFGLDRAHVVAWNSDLRQLERHAIADGKLAGKTKLAHDVDRNIVVAPDGSYFVSLNGRYPGDPPDSSASFRARVDAKTGKLLATWRAREIEWGNAISPNGMWAASVGVGRVMRLRWNDPKAPVDMPVRGDRPYAVTISRDAKTIGYVTSEAGDNFLVVFDAKSGNVNGRSEVPGMLNAVEISPDGSLVAIASRFGELAIHDVRTGAKRCSSTELPGSKIFWYGNRIVTHFTGDNGDDCDEITLGAIAVGDDRCRLIKRHEIYGLMPLLETNAKQTTVAIAKWKNECGYGFELVPYKAFAIDHQTGAKTPVPKLDGEADRREKAAVKILESETATTEERAIAEGNTLVSGDGRTRVTWSYDEHIGWHCSDVATKKTLVRHPISDGVGLPEAISSDGRWIVAIDRGSLLVYPCRQ
jgi:hypothetical protein